MQEVFKLLIVLAIVAVCNVVGGLINNVKLQKFKFSWKKLLDGCLQFLGVGAMFLGLAYAVFIIPDLGGMLGVEPKALIIAAIGVYAGKVLDQLIVLCNLKKEIKANDRQEDKADTECVDM